MRTIIIALVLYRGILLGQQPFATVKKCLDQNNFGAADKLLDSCASREYKADSTLYYQFHSKLKQEDVKAARKKLKKLETDHPTFSEITYMKGLLKFTAGDYAGSADDFSKVIAGSPGNVKALYNRALAFGMMEDFSKATEDLNTCISKDPSFPDAYYSRAHWREYLGLYDEAAQDYEQVIKHQPENFDAYIALAFIHHLQKNEQGACDIIKKAIGAGSQAAAEAQYLYCK
jgi:tetratricopeptide (TPR) repeat protein